MNQGHTSSVCSVLLKLYKDNSCNLNDTFLDDFKWGQKTTLIILGPVIPFHVY